MNTTMTKITTFLFCCVLLAGTSSVFGAQLLNLPFYADDLKSGERWSTKDHAQTRTQKFAYDLRVRRYISKTKTWSPLKIDSKTHWKNPKNSNYLVYGKPVYAMADGEVIRCWRNAPENPRPRLPGEQASELKDKLWLHKEYRNKRIPGGGNALVIQQNDGTSMLYAHMQPGTIPPGLCPHNKSLYDIPDNKSEADVPVGKRAKVKKGQFLGLVGNSGSSPNPHLHIQMVTKDGNAVKMFFARGLSTNNKGNKGDINKWSRFAGKTIPVGPVLIWPPRKIKAEYARHGFPAKNSKDFLIIFQIQDMRLSFLMAIV